MNSRTLSPIERMIDAATGYTPGAIPKIYIRITCPICKNSKLVQRDDIDPPTATEAIFPCPKHPKDETNTPEYRDHTGNPVPI